MKKILLFCITLLCGCSVHVNYTAEDVIEDPEKLLVEKSFIIGENIQKSIGERLIYRRDVVNMHRHLMKDLPDGKVYSGNKKVMVNTFTPKNSFSLETYNGTVNFSSEKKYYSVYKYEKFDLIQTHLDVGKRRWMLYLPVDESGIVQGDSFYISKRHVYPQLALANGITALKSHIKFEFDNDNKYEFIFLGKSLEPIDEREQIYFFEQEIIYAGKTQNTINLVYRELYTNAIKPGMSVELHYDLAQSNIIHFKGYRIEVINATNQSIEYRVLSE